MRKDLVSSYAPQKISSVSIITAVLVSLVCVPVVSATQSADPVRSDRQIKSYLSGLAQDQRRSLQTDINRSVHRASSGDDASSIPDHQLYHGLFLDLLMNPSRSASLPAQDLELIAGLPSHDDRRFVTIAREAMATACKIIERTNPATPGAVDRALAGIGLARGKVSDMLDRHYRIAIGRLTETGRQLVASEYERLKEQDSLLYVELDLYTLGFSQPDFVLAFLQDSCANAERVLASVATDNRTLRDQLETDNARGALQYFQPHR